MQVLEIRLSEKWAEVETKIVTISTKPNEAWINQVLHSIINQNTVYFLFTPANHKGN